MKRQPTEQEKIFANDISDNVQNKELKQLNIKKGIQLKEKDLRTWFFFPCSSFLFFKSFVSLFGHIAYTLVFYLTFTDSVLYPLHSAIESSHSNFYFCYCTTQF